MIDSAATSAALQPDVPEIEDPFVAEVRATRATIARDAGYDLGRIVADLRRIELDERAQGRIVIATDTPLVGPAA